MTRELGDSGTGWLGDIPTDWSVVPARAMFGERKQKSSATDVHLTPSQKYGVLPQVEYMDITGNKVVLNLSGADNMRHVEAGDYVSHLRSFQGGLEFAGMPGKVSAAYTVLKPKVAIEPRFFKYLFKSDLYIQALQTTTDQLRDGQSIRYGQFALIPLPRPAIEEQRAIADYLDRETAQIDAFIAKNEELISLLTERRAVAVDRAIGWGTTPDVATGEWLGCVPNGWSLAPLRRWMRFITSGSRGWGQFYSDEGSDVFLRIGDLQRDRLELRPVARQRVELPVGEEGVRARTQPGDLLISITADLGSVAVIDIADAGAYVSQHVALVRLDKERLNSRFGAYVVSSSAGKTHFEKAAYGGTKIQLSLPDVREMPIAVPSLDEQVRIVQHLDAVTDDVDEAIETARRAIELARERRAALISAAVTGKIDVGVAE
ncbi:restriction endonuclease subunit S [Microbacterium esteraromaticum]|uniref:Restriction endonuclease subunit S n=1 Tax=Microbacterium esteraromaticum TaxID=57043 RepID=A0A939IUB4_9MICO|nr:restriction endonuclease subunit S [Microbacterium esteraromaticum]MBN8204849.1 restriction endonuclease subunit S [Microbacterium esteraromaticum]MBN8415003.1 restriction endonuclease subunit S [Microbacterium esteraromaticum]